MSRELLFSVTKKDCNFDYYVGSGKGGQKRNRTANCVRCTHMNSGAVGKSEDGRSQRKNKEMAFKRMSDTVKFKKWHTLESSRRMGVLSDTEADVVRLMVEANIRIEKREDGKWIKY